MSTDIAEAAWQVRVATGEVADRYELQDDFVHLAHNNGAYLLGQTFSILGVRECVPYAQSVLCLAVQYYYHT